MKAIWLTFLTVASLAVSGCATNVGIGERVFITPSDSAHLSNCKMLGQVEVDASVFWKWGVREAVAEIKNRLRDETARRYPQADTVTHSDLDTGTWNGPEGNVMGTAFNCFE